MTSAFEALRRAPSDFAVTPDDIWDDRARPHVPGINVAALRAIEMRIDAAERSPRSSVKGLPLVGQGGSGKSHLLGQGRRLVQERGGFFVRLNITHVRDFWGSLASSYLYALNQPHRRAETGLAHLLQSLAELAGVSADLQDRLLKSRQPDPDSAEQFIESVRKLDASVAGARTTLRVLLLLHSLNERQALAADTYLNGGEFDAERVPGFGNPLPKPHKAIVQELSQLMAVCGATVIGVDQVDDIIRASKRSTAGEGESGTGELLDMLGIGLVDVRDCTRRTTVLLSCLDGTWEEFKRNTADTVLDRFESRVWLDNTLPSPEVASALLAAVLEPVYDDAGYEPPYPAYPFNEYAVSESTLLSPRQLLSLASAHLNRCVENGEVVEAERLGSEPKGMLPPRQRERSSQDIDELDAVFAAYQRDVVLATVVNPSTEASLMPRLLGAALRAYKVESGRSAATSTVGLPVGERQAFHAELTDEDADPTRCWSFLALSNANPIAVQNRVNGLYRRAGLGQDNPLRDGRGVLWVTVEDHKWGSWGRATKAFESVYRFGQEGLVIMAVEQDLRILEALRRMEEQRRPGFEAWLRQRRPASRTVLFREVFGDPAEPSEQPGPDGPGEPPGPQSPPDRTGFAAYGSTTFIDVPLPPLSAKAVANGGAAKGGTIYVGAVGSGAHSSVGAIGETAKGQIVSEVIGIVEPPEAPPPPVAVRSSGGRLGLDLSAMSRHTGAFAGSGSGKTVLLRRIIEAAALQGVSSIVLDPNNDLSRLGTSWPEPPESWLEGDAEAAASYHDKVEVVVWTPGRSSGRPLSFQPLPDFASVQSDHDEFEQVVDTAVASLVPRARIGRSTAKDDQARAVLREALVAFAQGGRSDFGGFLDFLDELPEHASTFAKASETAARIAATLRAAAVNDRVFAGDGEPVDPGVLLQPSAGKRARISVVNFLGLPEEEQRQGFVNQLELALFAWAKRNPAVGRPLSGLFVLDEAQVFAPSTGSTLCLDSTIALASQARKYGLGMLFATQSPKGIHNRIVGNCATHWYGRINSPSQIAAAAEVAQNKGGSPVDLAHLRRGQFYLVADGRPTELVEAPMCLSYHPPTAPTSEEILAAVRDSRQGGDRRE